MWDCRLCLKYWHRTTYMPRRRVEGRVSKWDSKCFDQFWPLLRFGCFMRKSLHENINSFELNSDVLQIAPGIEFRVPEG